MKKTPLYFPYKKHYTPDWFILNLFFIKVLMVRLNERAYGRFLVDIATSFQISSRKNLFLYFFPVSEDAKQSRVNKIVVQLECDKVKRIYNSKLADTIAKLIWPIIEKGLRPLSVKLFYFFNKDKIQEPKVYRRVLLKKPLTITIPKILLSDIEVLFDKHNIPPNNKIATLNFRESNHDVELNYDNCEKKTRSRRNGSVDNYLPLVKNLVDRGYLVVRTGDSTSTPMGNISGFVDLTQISLQDRQLLEVYFIIKSNFFIAGDSGAFFMYVLTGTPCLMVNMSHWIQYPLRSTDMMLLKSVRNLKTGKFLSIYDMFTAEYNEFKLDLKRYEYVDNNYKELIDATYEMEEINSTSKPLSNNQRKFSLLAKTSSLKIERNASKNPAAARDFLKWGGECGFIGNGRIASIFFENNEWTNN